MPIQDNLPERGTLEEEEEEDGPTNSRSRKLTSTWRRRQIQLQSLPPNLEEDVVGTDQTKGSHWKNGGEEVMSTHNMSELKVAASSDCFR